MSRIEAALTRIEKVAGNRSAGAGDAGGDQALRQRVGAALQELDALIGRLEP